MKVTYGRDALEAPESGAGVTIGTFDGVHLGHRTLIAATISAARERNVPACVVTWDRHPFETLRPSSAPPLITSPERKLELLAGTGIARVAVLPFDSEFASWPPEKFVLDVLVKGLGARVVIVGDGWRFGHRAAGDVPLLARLGREFGFDAHALDLRPDAGEPVSSSRVRTAVAGGDLDTAHLLLGRPFDIDGEVVRGDARGKDLGFPTANIAPDPALVRPPRGVYACRARFEESWFAAAVNVGVNPTFGGAAPVRIEAYLLGFDGDLYGRTIRIEFLRRLRDEHRFDSADALIEQMRRDVDETRAIVDDPRLSDR
jgi:riboflavin kinase / FMN adenylyltransferase